MLCGSVGIVIRRLSRSSYKYIVLDKQYGRIELISRGAAMTVGSLVNYSLTVSRNLFLMSDLFVLYIPISLGASDLLFFHHVLELIYYFAPIGSCVAGVFDLLAFLYTTEHMLISVQFKKFFLLKLLTLLGASPDEGGNAECIAQLHSISINEFTQSMLDSVNERKLDKWLWLCMVQHPYSNEFKTVHFLEKNRTV